MKRCGMRPKSALILLAPILVTVIPGCPVGQGDSRQTVNWTYDAGLDDFPKDILRGAGGGYLILGTTNYSSAFTGDMTLISVDERGKILWTKDFEEYGFTHGESIIGHPLGGYLLGGDTGFSVGGIRVSSDYFLVHIDSQGNEIRRDTFASPKPLSLSQIHSVEDGGFILAGNQDNAESYILKLDDDWQEEWAKSVSIDGESVQLTGSVVTNDALLVICGYLNNRNRMTNISGGTVAIFVGLDSTGEIVWVLHSGENAPADMAFSIIEDDHGKLISCGHEYYTSRNILWKIDSKGRLLSKHVYDHPLFGFTTFATIANATDGDFVVVGTNQDFLRNPYAYPELRVVRFSFDGAIRWERFYTLQDPVETKLFGQKVTSTAEGGFAIVSSAIYIDSGYSPVREHTDIALVKTDKDGYVEF